MITKVIYNNSFCFNSQEKGIKYNIGDVQCFDAPTPAIGPILNPHPLFPQINFALLSIPVSIQPISSLDAFKHKAYINFIRVIDIFAQFRRGFKIPARVNRFCSEEIMVAPEDDDNSNCFFDFSLIEQIPVPGGELPSLESDFHWSSNPFPGPSNLSAGFLDSSGKPNCSKELGSRKRVNPGLCSSTDTKACREKRRRDKLNERFQELNEILDPGRPPKTDKTVILGDAIRRVNQLRDEALKLKESAQELQTKINELKAEKNELRDEKQKLKAEKERLEEQVKAFGRSPAAATTAAFFPPPPHAAMPIPFPANHMVDGKFMPIMGYHGVPMWPFAPTAAVDTSEDHVHRSPLA
ncbi:unnamed protein product [Lactuca saligna]|uniref:BHLH domain-containing protein n=1 Tax=Lactuca saligna TaxID=75948 RepID=A0AA36E1U4_LACSI|nr:unnamed protein product [Lactuca saligna]